MSEIAAPSVDHGGIGTKRKHDGDDSDARKKQRKAEKKLRRQQQKLESSSQSVSLKPNEPKEKQQQSTPIKQESSQHKTNGKAAASTTAQTSKQSPANAVDGEQQAKAQRNREKRLRKKKKEQDVAVGSDAATNEHASESIDQENKASAVDESTEIKREVDSSALKPRTKAEKKAARRAEEEEAQRMEAEQPPSGKSNKVFINVESPTSAPAVKDEPIEHSKSLRRKQRKDKQIKRRQNDITPDADATKTLRAPQQKNVKKGKDVALVRGSRRTDGWTFSQPSGGRFLSHDPIFVADNAGEEFMITANDREVQVLSLDNSLIVRTHPAPNGVRVQSYAVDNGVSGSAFIAYSDGAVWRWDWQDRGSQAEMIQSRPGVRAMTFAKRIDGNTARDPFLIYKESQGSGIAYGGRQLHSTEKNLQDVLVLGNGEYVLARGPLTVVVGSKRTGIDDTTSYVWLEIPLSSPSTCFDTQLLSPPTSGKKGANNKPGIRLAIGSQDGKIQLYDDISPLFRQNAQQSLPSPRLLHWHREAVSSLKFSPDSNYLISGGRETVLVIWQLQTGKRQFLPHLTSEIERIVVNPVGDRYAVQMGDNSIMVLNTSELKPVANFAGLQALQMSSGLAPAAAIHPRIGNQLLVTVPASQPKADNAVTTRPFLQTYDMRTSRHILRQALTRNNITDFSTGPEQTPITPPDVEHLAISNDGTWLATVDEWVPPATDMDSFATTAEQIQAERLARRETYLKFWTWNEGQQLWTLTTRVDSPHHRDGGLLGAGRVYALVSNPAAKGFATTGEDGYVRLWKAKTRTRHGVAMKNDQGIDVVEWVCRRSVRLEVPSDHHLDSYLTLSHGQDSGTASMAYSSDGSMVAVARAGGDNLDASVVHFIDTAHGDAITRTDMAAAEITSVGFVDRYFVAVSRSASYVWDLVTDNLVYQIDLNEKDPTPPLLTTNEADGTFALTIKRTIVKVYNPSDWKCLHEQKCDRRIEAVLANVGTRGYTFLFADSTIRTLLPPAASGRALPGLPPNQEGMPAVEAAPAAEDEGMIDLVEPLQQRGGVVSTKLTAIEDAEDDRPVVRPEQLAEVLDVGGTVMPPVSDMFRAVVGLYGRKPHVRAPLAVGA